MSQTSSKARFRKRRLCYSSTIKLGLLLNSCVMFFVTIYSDMSMNYQSQSLLVKNSSRLRPKYILHSRNDNDLIKESFVDHCLTRANERNIRPFEGAWYNSKRPHFSGVVLSPRRHKRYNSQNLYWHVIFNLGGMKNGQTIPGISARRRQKWVSKGIWFCDGRPASLVGKGCPNGETLVIICPQTEHDAQPGLVTVRNITYYIGDHIDCFLTRTFRRPNVSGAIAANAFLFGESMKYPRRMMEWVEYHRMIGVDHFFIYYMGNYSSDEKFQMPNFPYLTYLPYNLMDESNFFDLTKSFRFQKTQQMDAIYRARGLGYSWLLMLDIDEYIQFGNMSLTLPEYLTDFLQIHRKTSKSNIGGISIQSTSFGAAHGEPRFPDLMIDHIWKRQTMFVGERQKSIVRPNHVDYYAIHGVTSGDFEVHAEPNIIRIAHYRRPELGVFLATLPKRDSAFRDFWHDKLKARLDVVWSEMKEKYSSREEVWSTDISFTFYDENKTRKMYSNA